MHGTWACTVCVANAQNAGLLALARPAEANIDRASQEKLKPFVVLTGVQGLLAISSFLLSTGHRTATATARRKKDEGLKRA